MPNQTEIKGGAVPSRVDWPAHDSIAVTPSDATVINYRGLYIGVAGNVAIMPANSNVAVTFVGVPAGTVLPVAGVRVMATNTTASSIVALC